MFGHGVFVYNPNDTKDKFGTWDGAAQAIADLGMSHAWIRGHGKDGLYYPEENKKLIAALRARGVTVFVWGWCHGIDVANDITNASHAITEFAPDGYVADIEHGVSGAQWSAAKIKTFLSAIRPGLAGKPLVLSTFGFIPYHEPELMKAADPLVDAFAPQVYWFWFPKQAMTTQPGAKGPYQENNAADYVNLCLDVWRHISKKPIIITGQAYWKESPGWTQQWAEKKLNEFATGFNRWSEIAGLNWWHLAGDAAMSSDMAKTIRNANFGVKAPTAAAGPAIGPQAMPAPWIAATGLTPGRVFVKTDGLALRTSPNGPKLFEFSIGDELLMLGDDSTDPKWKRVAFGAHSGVAFGYYLRPPAADECEALLKNVIREWTRFQKGTGNEKLYPFYEYVREMWQSIGEPYDGRSKYPNGKDVPWSAAFISFVVRRSGPKYAQFSYAPSHSQYVNDAILARRTERSDKPFWGYRPSEVPPTLGDIVQRNRSGNAFSFDYAENHATYESHSDVVVECNDHIARVIGGNIGDTVTLSDGIAEYKLDTNGLLKSGQGIISLLKNRAASVT